MSKKKQIIQRNIAKLLHPIKPLRMLMYWLYFAICKLTIPPESLVVAFESEGGWDYSGEPRALFDAMAADERYEAFDFRWSVQPEKKKIGAKLESAQTKTMARERRYFFRQMARAKYWITDGPLPKYMKPGRTQVWILTPPAGGVHERGNGASEHKLGKRVKCFLSESPEDTKQIIERYGLGGDISKVFETGSFRRAILRHARPEDALQARMNHNIPLARKVVFLDIPYDAGVENALKMLPADQYTFITKGKWPAFLNMGDVPELNELYLASDLLVTENRKSGGEFSELKRPVAFYGTAEQTGTLLSAGELAAAIEGKLRESVWPKTALTEGKDSSGVLGIATDIAEKLVPPDGEPTKRHMLRRANIERRKVLFYSLTGFFRRLGICPTGNMRRLVKYKNAYKGRRCFLVGNGPSLTGHDLEMLKDEITFGCNLIYKSFELTEWRPTYYFVVDNLYGRSRSEEIRSNISVPIFMVRSIKNYFMPLTPDIVWGYDDRSDNYRPRGNPLHGINVKHSSVMILMIEMAVYMGFSEIYLIGVDAGNTGSKSSAYFMDGYKSNEAGKLLARRAQLLFEGHQMSVEELGQYTMKKSHAAYYALREFADKRDDVTIYNATRGGFLEAFERVRLEDVPGMAGAGQPEAEK